MSKYSRRDFLKSMTAFFVYFMLPQKIAWTQEKEGKMNEPSYTEFTPAYRALHKSGELKKRGEALWQSMSNCHLCPRECGTNRLAGHEGFCRASAQLEISNFAPHFGEERPLVGRNGSGTIFLTNCSLLCVFCINAEISHEGKGNKATIDDFAGMMLFLQRKGCHNINFVTPSHYSPHILLALDKAASKGLNIPVVYNTCGWEKLDVLKMLDGVVDIYLPDFKYMQPEMASLYSAKAYSYPEIAKKALVEMNRQVGTAISAGNNIMQRGLMIRHLVMPNDVGGSKEIMAWIAENLPKNTYVNIMSQYQPCYKAKDYPAISRRITKEEYEEVVRAAREAGLTNLEIQGAQWLYHRHV